MTDQRRPNPKTEHKVLEPEVERLVIECVWKWLGRLVGLVILIAGIFSGLGILAAKVLIQNKVDSFADSMPNAVADVLSHRSEFVTQLATQTCGMPVGTILTWWGNRQTIPAGWAPCDGSFPEPNWREKTPDLSGRVLIGASDANAPRLGEAIGIKIPEPERELQTGGGAPPNKGLGDGGKDVDFWPMPEYEPFFERVKAKIPAKGDHEISLCAENLPRAEVYFIIRYK